MSTGWPVAIPISAERRHRVRRARHDLAVRQETEDALVRREGEDEGGDAEGEGEGAAGGEGLAERHGRASIRGRSGRARTVQSRLDGRAPGKIRRSPLRRLLRRPQAPPCRERGRRRVRIRARDPRAGRDAAPPPRRQGRRRAGPDGHGQDGRVPDRDLRASRPDEAAEALAVPARPRRRAHARARDPDPGGRKGARPLPQAEDRHGLRRHRLRQAARPAPGRLRPPRRDAGAPPRLRAAGRDVLRRGRVPRDRRGGPPLRPRLHPRPEAHPPPMPAALAGATR